MDEKDIEKPVGEIEEIEVVKAYKIFGEKAYDPEKSILRMKLKSFRFQPILNMPRGLEYKDGKFEVTDYEGFHRSCNHPNSQFGKFMTFFGLPRIGKSIPLKINKKGWIEIDYSRRELWKQY